MRRTRRPTANTTRGLSASLPPEVTRSSTSPPMAIAIGVAEPVATLLMPMYRPADALGMMSVISAQSTARNVPFAAPNSAAPTRAMGIDGVSAMIAAPDGAAGAGREDQRLAPDAVGQPRGRAGSRRTFAPRPRPGWPRTSRSPPPSSCRTHGRGRSRRSSRAASRRSGRTAARRAARRRSAPGGCRSPRPRGRCVVHDFPWRGLGGIPFPTRRTTLAIVTSSTSATATSDELHGAQRPTDSDTSRNPVTLPTTCMRPTIPLAMPDLWLRDEVRDVALERPAGDVRAERQQDHERREHERPSCPSRSPAGTPRRAATRRRCNGLRRPQRDTV